MPLHPAFKSLHLSLYSCPSAQPPTCHLDLRAMGHSCRICVTSMHTYTNTSTNTHTHTCDCQVPPLWTVISEVSAAGLAISSLRAGGISQPSRGNDRVCLDVLCVCVCLCLWNIWGHIWNLNQLIRDGLSNWGQNQIVSPNLFFGTAAIIVSSNSISSVGSSVGTFE